MLPPKEIFLRTEREGEGGEEGERTVSSYLESSICVFVSVELFFRRAEVR